MKRLIWLLFPLLLFLAACASGGDDFAPADVAAPGEEVEPTATATAGPAATTAAIDDPTLARERDWKQGDLTEPAVTIIEYGDFQ